MTITLKRLGDIATYVNGYAFKPTDWKNKGLPIIRIQNLTNPDSPFNYYQGEIDDKYIVNKGDILISWSASLGVFEWLGEKAVLNQHIFKVIFDKEDIDKSYFKYIVQRSLERALKYLHGSTMKHITKKYFDNILVPIPDLVTQKKIAKVLDKAQELIDKRKAQIAALDQLAQSVFLEMFGDPITNNKAWPVISFSQVIKDIRYGTSTPPKFAEEGYMFVRATNIKNGKITKDNMLYISHEEAESIQKCKLNFGELIFVRSGVNSGDNAVVTEEFAGHYGGYDIIVQIDQNLVNPHYLNSLFNSSYLEVVIKPLTRRAGQPHLNADQIKGLKIPLPPIHLQQEFTVNLKKIEKQKELLQKSLMHLEINFNSLMQRAFKGELFND